MTDWQELLYTRSESDALSAIHTAINRGEVLDGLAGLEEMIHLLAEVAIGPLSGWPQGRGLLSKLRVFRFGVFELEVQGHQCALALLQAFAMAFGLGLGHLVLLDCDRLGLLVHPRVGFFQ